MCLTLEQKSSILGEKSLNHGEFTLHQLRGEAITVYVGLSYTY